MDSSNELQILIRRKIPYISTGLAWILGILLVVVFVFVIAMSPTQYNSDEMKVAYYILVVPDWLKIISIIAGAGLIIIMPLYFSARLYRPALLTINSEAIIIKGDNLNFCKPLSSIYKIYFNDLKNLLRHPKNKLQIVIEQKDQKTIVFLLKNYNDGEKAMNMLGEIDKAKFAFYDDDMLTTHEEE
ncbi:MAG: hypothetical protein ABI405_02430 [Parafilimonas sp.]